MENLTVRKVSLGLTNRLYVRLLFHTRKGIIHNSTQKLIQCLNPCTKKKDDSCSTYSYFLC